MINVRIASWKEYLAASTTDYCAVCGQSPESGNHILFNCPFYIKDVKKPGLKVIEGGRR